MQLLQADHLPVNIQLQLAVAVEAVPIHRVVLLLPAPGVIQLLHAAVPARWVLLQEVPVAAADRVVEVPVEVVPVEAVVKR